MLSPRQVSRHDYAKDGMFYIRLVILRPKSVPENRTAVRKVRQVEIRVPMMAKSLQWGNLKIITFVLTLQVLLLIFSNFSAEAG